MYGKLFARITESSLMEESIPVRYTFAFMIAIADPAGYVIGTDVAIARRLNMPLKDFQDCLAVLLAPDSSSNSKEEDGRRVVPSDGERGYFLVNYGVYRDMKDQKDKRTYMRDYMRDYRANGRKTVPINELDDAVKNVKQCKEVLVSPSSSPSTYSSPSESKKEDGDSLTEFQIRLSDGIYDLPQQYQIIPLVAQLRRWANHMMRRKPFCASNLESILLHYSSAGWSPEKLQRGIILSLSKNCESTIIDPDEQDRKNGKTQASQVGAPPPRKKKSA